jgi:hypothetical protein
VIRSRSKTSLAVACALAALVVFLLPALVAYRYTAPAQRNEFVSHPWRGWSFAVAALAVPGGSKLKTSGMALRKAVWLYKGTAVDPREVQLLFVPPGKPYRFRHAIGGRTLTSSVTPAYRFIWQVQGIVDTVSTHHYTLVAMLDYDTGRLLYDVRHDLLPAQLQPESTATPLPLEPTPSGSPSTSPGP